MASCNRVVAYLSMRRDLRKPVAIMDRSTRKVLAWSISNMLEADFLVEALNEAITALTRPRS